MTNPFNYKTKSGLQIIRRKTTVDYHNEINRLAEKLDSRLGCLLSSSYEYPNRYKRWDLGLVDPMIVICSKSYGLNIRACNRRGEIVLGVIDKALQNEDYIESYSASETEINLTIKQTTHRFAEEERSKQPSVFSVIRSIRELFFSDEDNNFGLYGALGYDLTFQFEKIDFKLERAENQRDMVLFLPDAVFVRDHERVEASVHYYDFLINGQDTSELPREGSSEPFQGKTEVEQDSDHYPGEYAEVVRKAQQAFFKGDLFETVPGQTFFFPCKDSPSTIFNRLKHANPSPYGFYMNLGQQEYLVGASPEMFVRVSGDTVETCPISGTIARGNDALGDADQIRTLLNSEKDLSELTMCTDVDRNDKSRICVPGSIQVVGRRQIELYSKLIHTVDHVKGRLRKGFDALDAFLSHTWAVTVTGAPKIWAMQFIEDNEKSPRRWYGGAVGRITFDGNINTGLTLRTVRIEEGVAEVRAGATLLYDSVPEDEEAETRLKASALIQAITHDPSKDTDDSDAVLNAGEGVKILMVDHEDSFVNTLADYFRQTGASVTTLRYGFEQADVEAIAPDLVVLSPGPGQPSDFNLSQTIEMMLAMNLPMFGVCLGLQGMVQYFGGDLSLLSAPQHGKNSSINVLQSDGIFKGIKNNINVGRYHSLHAAKASFPECLEITSETEEGVVMGIQHKTLPMAAVQFHPESIMTLENQAGLKLINNVYSLIKKS
ncbi:anthranilate synthase component I [Agarilytica rhodophyticola]|uniref:anthranilate synthase component I n=1 Tax=Agarilytica rhodophyticola TaxID=1737490 RepID=UPI000B34145B|nr:anthranilate synthase component I [Agarilytica rhodophyticola]